LTSDNNFLLSNKITGCSFVGIDLDSSFNNTLYWNTVCNPGTDIRVYNGSLGNTGINNICDTPYGWNDQDTSGCTYTCDENVPTVTEWGFLLILVLFTLKLRGKFKPEKLNSNLSRPGRFSL